MNRRKNVHEELKKHIHFLVSHKEIIEASKVKYEANFWSIKKLILLSRYLYPYLLILTSKENEKYKYSQAWFYLDLFSGPGASIIKNRFELLGSPIISLLKGIYYIRKRKEYIRFTKWFFVDINKDFCFALRRRVNRTLEQIKEENDVTIPKEDIRIIQGDCNKNMTYILREIEKYEKPSMLIFIDPEGITEIEWPTFEKLLKKRFVDIIYILSTGGLKRGLKPIHLEKNLPPFPEEIKKKLLSGKYLSEDLVKLFAEKIFKELQRRRLFYDSIPVYNEKNTEIYRIIWASSSVGGAHAISETLKFLKQINNEDIIRAFQVVSGKQLELKNFLSKAL
jgi:three-Cys-motif partner protein